MKHQTAFYAIKIFILCSLLAAVLYGISHLDKSDVERAFGALGIEPGAETSPGLQPSNRMLAQGERRMNLCRTRVHAIIWPDGRRIEEQSRGLKMSWAAVLPDGASGQVVELNYLEIEKWFSLHCQIVVARESDHAMQSGAAQSGLAQPYLKLEFVDAGITEILREGEDTYRIGNRSFVSRDLTLAVSEIKTLAFGK
jgi:hypothetical protein